MSLLVLIRSEEQLRSGKEWAVRFAEAGNRAINVAVLGTNRSVLVKHAQAQLSESVKTSHIDLKSVCSVEESVDSVNDLVHRLKARWLVIMHSVEGPEFQRELFQHALCGVVWLRPAGHPPISEDHLIALEPDTNRRLVSACHSLLDMVPQESIFKTHLVDESAAIEENHSEKETDLGTGTDLDLGTLKSETGPTESGDVDSQGTVSPGTPGTATKAAVSQSPLDAWAEVVSRRMNRRDDLLVALSRPNDSKSAAYRFQLQLIQGTVDTSVALIRVGPKVVSSLAERFLRLVAEIAPPMSRSQRLELSSDLESGSAPNWEYLGLISASAMLAAFGLLQNSAAVIIGAMLIAPLMTPILGASMAISRGDRPLLKTAWLTILTGFFGALTASVLFGCLVLCFQAPEISDEMWSRCRPSPLDFCVGLVGGMAAAYARTRSHLSSALAGAAIAAALVPPISTAGLQIAFSNWHWNEKGIPVFGPILLVTINVLTIMIGGSFVLWARGIRVDRTLDQGDRWTLRILIALVTIALLLLAGVVKPDMIFPASSPS